MPEPSVCRDHTRHAAVRAASSQSGRCAVPTSIRSLFDRWIDDRGQTLVVVSGALLTLILALGLVFDVGFIYEQRRQLQNAVDAAALAAAVAERDEPSHTVSAANAYMLANGFDPSGPAISVSVDPAYSPNQVEVSATLEVSTIFFRLIDVDSKTVTVRAVGEAQPRVGVADYAIVTLNQTDCDSFRKGGTADLEIIGGGIMVNSSCSTNAGRAHGNGSIVADRVDYFSGGGFQTQGSASVSPAPSSRSTRTTDPLGSLPIPSEPTSTDSGGTAASPSTRTISSSTTLHPGTYWGGLHLSGNATYTMLPGVYVMAGGGFTSAGNGLIQGDGVMIYITGHPGAADCGFVNLTGGKDLAITPPTSGAYKYITFWQDEDCTADFGYRGGHDATTGVIYAPGAQVSITGGGDLGSIQLIADRVYVSGNTDYTIDFSGYVGDSGTGTVLIAE